MFGLSLEARAIAFVLLMVAALAGWHRLTGYYDGQGYARARAEDQAAAELQREANRGRARTAEVTYTARAASREQFFDATAKGVHDASAPLAACLIPEPVRVRLNAAAACARGDPAASCGDNDPVPSAR